MRLPKKIWLCLVLAIWLSACFISNATADKRVALVIGNAAYKSRPLRNPENDAQDMSTVLRRADFTVHQLTNATRKQMHQAIDSFRKSLSGSETGLFYYSGHGSQWEGQNYLIPIGADITESWLIEDETVTVRRVLRAMEAAGSKFNIVIFDACRSSPFRSFTKSGDQGLARMNAPKGTLLAFATAPGNTASDGTGRNSPYTKHLVRAIATPGLSIEQVFKKVRVEVERETGGKQLPWEESSLMGDFYFKGDPESGATISGSAGEASQAELLFWQSIEDSGDVEMYRAYLDKYPEGLYIELAGRWLDKLKELEGTHRLEGTHQIGSNVEFNDYTMWFWDEPYSTTFIYSGQLTNGKPDGYGTAVFTDESFDGNVYKGDWVDGLMEGYGVWTEDGGYYSGEFKKGMMNGEATMVFPKRDEPYKSYVGEVENDFYHGHGILTFTSGDKYIGDWKLNSMHGSGTYTNADGSKYVGEWKDDERWSGKEYDKNGKLSATWSAGNRTDVDPTASTSTSD